MQEGVPRKKGSRDGDYEHPPLARCSSEPYSLAHLWLLSVRAESNIRLYNGTCPAGRNSSHKKGGSDLSSHSHKKFLLRAQKGNEVSHKAFLPTFFSEKSRLPADDVFRNLPQRLSGLHIKALAAGQVGQRDDAHQLSSLHHRQAAHLLAGHELGGGPAIVLG